MFYSDQSSEEDQKRAWKVPRKGRSESESEDESESESSESESESEEESDSNTDIKKKKKVWKHADSNTVLFPHISCCFVMVGNYYLIVWHNLFILGPIICDRDSVETFGLLFKDCKRHTSAEILNTLIGSSALL